MCIDNWATPLTEVRREKLGRARYDAQSPLALSPRTCFPRSTSDNHCGHTDAAAYLLKHHFDMTEMHIGNCCRSDQGQLNIRSSMEPPLPQDSRHIIESSFVLQRKCTRKHRIDVDPGRQVRDRSRLDCRVCAGAADTWTLTRL
jgi:hypothetical protein